MYYMEMAPPGEYDEMTCLAEAMQSVVTIIVET